jgi:death-on-curing protein
MWSKAAAMLQSILKSHPLVDGNKRLGWLATAVFLDLNGFDMSSADNDAVFEFVMSVAANDLHVHEIAERLRPLISE